MWRDGYYNFLILNEVIDDFNFLVMIRVNRDEN